MQCNMVRRFIGMAVFVVMLMSFAVIPGVAESADAATFAPGEYTAKGAGHNGDIEVSVVFEADRIAEIKVLNHAETPGIADASLSGTPQAILDAQSTQVDVVSGATFTSKGIIEAVNAVIVLAGGDPAALAPKSYEPVERQAVEKTADVVVVGGGLAGLSAAIKAQQGGASVILLEKAAVLGGSSALSGGSIGAVNTSVQAEYGIEDSAEAWKELWVARQATSIEPSQYPDWDRVDALIAASSDSIDWLRSLGYAFREPVGFGTDPVKRLHNPDPSGNGSVLTSYLGNKAAELGVEILLETPAVELIAKDGVVVGVKATGKTDDLTINAKSVILASGGFARSEALRRRFTPETAGYTEMSVSAAGNTGDGIMMAEAVGAAVYDDPWMIGLSLTSRVPNMGGFFWYGTYALVNKGGERFTNEADHYSIIYNNAVYKAADGAYMLFDSGEAFNQFVEVAKASEGHEDLFVADTIEALAEAIGVDAAALTATLEAYNAVSAGGEDALGKPAAVCVPLTQGPFYAVKVLPSDMGTMGGVVTNYDCEVLDGEGNPIPGLYAAGEMTNRPYYSQVYMTGSALQVATRTGQIAGENAAASAK